MFESLFGGEQVGPGLYVKLGLDSSGLVTGLGEVKGKLTAWRNETNASTRDLAKWGAAITANVAPIMAVGVASYAAIQKYGSMANSLKDLSYQTKVSTDQLQRMQYAAVLASTDFNRVAFGLNQLSLSMAEAQDPASAAYKAFMGLGVDPRGRTVDEVFKSTAFALVSMASETQRNAIAMDLYGRSWKDLLPYMEEYTKNLDKIEKFKGLSPAALQTLKDAKIKTDELTASWDLGMAGAIVNVSKLFDRLLLNMHAITIEEYKERNLIEATQNVPLGPEDYDWSKGKYLGKLPDFTPEELVARGAGIVDARARDREARARILENVVAKGGLTALQAGGMSMGVTVNIGTVVAKDPEDLSKRLGEALNRVLTRQRMARGYQIQ